MVERLVLRFPSSLLSNREDTDRPIPETTQAATATISTTRGGRRRFRLVGVMEAIQQPVKPPISCNPKPFYRSHICFLTITPFPLSISTIRDPLDHYLNTIGCGCWTLTITPNYQSWEFAFSASQFLNSPCLVDILKG